MKFRYLAESEPGDTYEANTLPALVFGMAAHLSVTADPDGLAADLGQPDVPGAIVCDAEGEPVAWVYDRGR